MCYELVTMLLKEEPNADPNMVGRDGSSPLMICLIPLINKDPLHSFTHSMKVIILINPLVILINLIVHFRCFISIVFVYFYNMEQIRIAHIDLI